MSAGKDDSQNQELKRTLQRHASSRTIENTFETTETSNKEPSIQEILQKAGRRALGGGLPGAMAMGIQVGSLMWLRTTMNYQYRYGTTTSEALRKLYADGGVRRFYRGVGPALFQGPLSRFGDTAANAGVLSILDSNESSKNLPVAAKTFCASVAAGTWRIFLMPIDCVKTTLQVEGANGMNVLKTKLGKGGPGVLYHGAFGAAGATLVGHYPWFFTFNTLNANLPKAETDLGNLGRNAVMGFSSSFVSDCTSNSIRVIKTTKQTSAEPITYPNAARLVIKADGVSGLFIRGLKTRIIANGFQGMLFTILWKGIQKKFFDEEK